MYLASARSHHYQTVCGTLVLRSITNAVEKPWKLVTARDGVCYIGIAFRRAEEKENTACCAAQMFLDTGDGIVFLGEYGPWYSSEARQLHLKKSDACNLLRSVFRNL